MARLKVAVLISGSGTNLQALIDACAAPAFPAEITKVISNRPGAGGIARAERAGIPVQIIDHKAFADRTAFDTALNEALCASGIELVCLAGFMRLLTAEFVTRWHDRLINIHPSLLPAFKGLHAAHQAVDAGVRVAGCTVHFVRAEMDSGPIIVQAAVPVRSDDTGESLQARIQQAEHLCYPQALKLIAEGRVKVDGDKTQLLDEGFTEERRLINPD